MASNIIYVLFREIDHNRDLGVLWFLCETCPCSLNQISVCLIAIMILPSLSLSLVFCMEEWKRFWILKIFQFSFSIWQWEAVKYELTPPMKSCCALFDLLLSLCKCSVSEANVTVHFVNCGSWWNLQSWHPILPILMACRNCLTS